MLSFGEKFRSARDTKGISLDQIAQETRISTRFLCAIEQEMFHLLPGGVFNRGFIRTYAAQVGLDPDIAVAEYEELIEEMVVEEPFRPHGLFLERHIVPAACAGLFVLIILFYIFAQDNKVVAEVTQPMAVRSQTVDRNDSAPSVNQSAILQSLSISPPLATARKSGNVRIQIQVHDTTWVAIAADGKEIVSGEILTAGTRRRYTAKETIELTIGNAAGLSIRINDREVPSLGTEGQVRVLIITPDNIDRYIGNSTDNSNLR